MWYSAKGSAARSQESPSHRSRNNNNLTRRWFPPAVIRVVIPGAERKHVTVAFYSLLLKHNASADVLLFDVHLYTFAGTAPVRWRLNRNRKLSGNKMGAFRNACSFCSVREDDLPTKIQYISVDGPGFVHYASDYWLIVNRSQVHEKTTCILVAGCRTSLREEHLQRQHWLAEACVAWKLTHGTSVFSNVFLTWRKLNTIVTAEKLFF